MDEELIIRARYMMSPFNVREARRARKHTRIVNIYLLALILITILVLVFGHHEIRQKNDRVGDRASQIKG